MSILKNIVTDIKKELKLKKSIIPISEYEKMSLFERNTISMTNSIKKDSFGIIAGYAFKNGDHIILKVQYSNILTCKELYKKLLTFYDSFKNINK